MHMLLIAALLAGGPAPQPTRIFVATNGSDAWSGRLAAPAPGRTDGPFATLGRARDEVRRVRGRGPVTVLVRGGTYPQPATLALGPEDSGTAGAPVLWAAFPGEKPLISGGRAIRGFTRYRDGILKSDLGAQGWRGAAFHQLICDGRRMDLARYPNRDAAHPVTGGWAYADGAPLPLYVDIPGEPQNLLRYREADARPWSHPGQAEVMVFPRYNWWNDILPVAASDPRTRTVTLAANASYAIRPGDRYFVQNLLEELDAPGEWFLDRSGGVLYFRPPGGADPARMAVSAPAIATILEMRPGAAHITFRGFTFECSEGAAIQMTRASDCCIAASVIRCVGDYGGGGVVIVEGRRCGVEGCDIHDVGRDAVYLGGGDLATLAPGRNYVNNCYIHHTGVYYKQGVGVSVGGVGNRISHNLIHDCPRFGISWGGNDHVFEFNEIRHCNLETADCGAIYSWQVDWSRRGTEIRYNYLHDIIGFGQENGKWTSPHMNWGVYLDDGTCGVRVYGNIVARTILGGVHVHGGRDNVIENNILIDGRDSQVQYSGYVEGGHPVPMMTDTWNKYHGNDAYLKYPGYAPLTRSLKDAWQMADNRFAHNIVDYAEPKAALYAHSNLPLDRTISDYNLIWHRGAPIETGITRVRNVKGVNLAPNAGFEEEDAAGAPSGWEWQVRPNDSTAALDARAARSGKRALRLEGRGTFTDSSGQTLTVNYVSALIPLKPGRTYRLAADVRADQPTSGAIHAQSYRPGGYFWARGTGFSAGTEWKRIETLFRLPTKGDPDWHEGMDGVRIRLDVSQGTGVFFVDEVELREVESMSGWEAWRAQGLDTHSRIADPLFVNRAAGDYRLRPGSPALALGFRPIPAAKIGPYRSPLRASWPIRQAVGAREQMRLDWSRH